MQWLFLISVSNIPVISNGVSEVYANTLLAGEVNCNLGFCLVPCYSGYFKNIDACSNVNNYIYCEIPNFKLYLSEDSMYTFENFALQIGL